MPTLDDYQVPLWAAKLPEADRRHYQRQMADADTAYRRGYYVASDKLREDAYDSLSRAADRARAWQERRRQIAALRTEIEHTRSPRKRAELLDILEEYLED